MSCSFPERLSLTVTNACNLRCRMCGQWSEKGYMRGRRGGKLMELADWKRLVDEATAHGVGSVLLRGGEPFLMPGVMELAAHIRSKGMFLSVDTNGTRLARYAADIVALEQVHLTISVDGPEETHDAVRGVKGCFREIAENLKVLKAAEEKAGRKISKSICFTISRYNYRAMGEMPAVARRLGLGSLTIVPYYYVPEETGKRYERELKGLGCQAFSWRGFGHEDSGVEVDELLAQLKRYKETLGEVYDFPYMPLSEDEYRAWFTDTATPVLRTPCMNVEKLIDVQPDGEANFCVDFIDYSIGNVKENTIEGVWNGEKAERFREYRREQPLAVCYRCGAKYMSEI